MLLSQVKQGESVVIVSLECAASRQRLLELGVFSGATVKVKGYAPLGDPMIIDINDCEIAIRKSEAQNIQVK